MPTSESLRFFDSIGSQTGEISKLSIPLEFPKIDHPLEWALEQARADAALVSTAMRSAFQDGPQDDQMIYASRGQASDKVRQALIQGVENHAAVQLQVNFINRKFAPLGQFIETHLNPRLRAIHPFGFDVGSSLWVTGPGHRYNAHCDLGNHCLLQIHGRKKVRLWGPTPGFDAEPLFDFDFRGQPERFSGIAQEVELNPGDMVYFSRGVMHEISIPEGEASVSISLAMESLYPLLTLLAAALPAARLHEEYGHWDKFRARVFDPDRYRTFVGAAMPAVLRDAVLAAVADPGMPTPTSALEEWWQGYARGGRYSPTGTLPRPPKNKEALLREWENARLAGD